MLLWLFVVAWYVVQNSYFGWNWRPQSDAELVSDGIGFVLVAIAITGTRSA